MDYFNDENSLLCVPNVVTYNIDLERGEVVDPEEVADKMLKYYTAKSLYNKHANKVKDISEKYKWKNEIGKMIDVLKKN